MENAQLAGADLPLIERFGRRDAGFSIEGKVRELYAGGGRRVALSGRWKSLDEALSFTHTALQVAYGAMLDAREKMGFKREVQAWRQEEEAAEMAKRALGVLLRSLSPADRNLKSAEFLAEPLRRRHNLKSPEDGYTANQSKAVADAETLLAAMRLLEELPAHFGQASKLAEAECASHAVLDRIEFLFPMALAWVYLTGRMPGKGPETERNPFLRFALAGWQDIGEEETGEDNALAYALRLLMGGEIKDRKVIVTDDPPFWLG